MNVPIVMKLTRIFSSPFYHSWRHPLFRCLVRRLVPRSIRNYYHAYRTGYFSYDKTRVILYADSTILPDYEFRRFLDFHSQQKHPHSRVTVITPATGKTKGIIPWLEALRQQTRRPDEVVIADQGLTEDDRRDIQAFSHHAPFSVRLVAAVGRSKPAAINMAIQNAACTLIAATEIACTPEVDWLENLLYPLDENRDIQLSAGFLQARAGSDFQGLCARILTHHTNHFHPPTFIPCWQTVAMRKELWRRADGYPEWPGDVPADTLFSYHARQSNCHWAVVPDAKVSVTMPHNLIGLYRQRYQDGLADGITGIDAARYWRKTLKLVAVTLLAGLAGLAGTLSPVLFGFKGWIVPGLLLVMGGVLALYAVLSLGSMYKLGIRDSTQFLAIRIVAGLARMRGFASGVCLRPAAQARQVAHCQSQLQQILDHHPGRQGIIVYPPTHDWGYMFQLPQQMARLFARKGYLYFYATINERTDDVTGFRQVEPNLYLCHVPFETFQILPSGTGEQTQQKSEQLILYIGSPWNRKYLPFFKAPVVIYDHYDDLAVSSGRIEDHQHLLEIADIVLVTSQRLLDNVKSARPDAIFAPNGVDYDHFQELRPAPDEAAPADLQPLLAKGRPIVGYTGAFTERVDYDLFLYLLRSRPDYEFVLIGANLDGSLDRSRLLEQGLDNVSWLGMKPHDELIKYLWRFQVGVVPFKINEITLATTSIKVFEYMACQVPVVSVAMPESKRYPGVFIAETYQQFIEHLDTALLSKTDPVYLETIAHVARANTWEKRVEKICGVMETTL